MIPHNNIDNSINTKKYNFYNFLPFFLFQELKISINIIFLCFTVFNWFFQISKDQFYNLFFVHLLMCLVTDCMKDVFMQIKSGHSDYLWNQRLFKIITQMGSKMIEAKNIKVGSIIELSEGELSPVDCIILKVVNENN